MAAYRNFVLTLQQPFPATVALLQDKSELRPQLQDSRCLLNLAFLTELTAK
jgi:hypothetical protein